MRILIVNDDGISAEGIKHLAMMASKLGEVWVVAPDNQCSAMSQKITVRGSLIAKPYNDFPIKSVKAYSVSGTPADCVKVAVNVVMPEKPDVVFSGINIGYNCGYDILYSGTVGACTEAIMAGIPAIAFSSEMNCVYDAVDEYILPITKELLDNPPATNEIWNVNFPGCPVDEVKGIVWDALPAPGPFYSDDFDLTKHEDGSYEIFVKGKPATESSGHTDIKLVLDRYISVGKIKNSIIR